MQVECMIIGQGIAGTMLAGALDKEGVSYVVIDDNRPSTASKIASGIINPLTGRRIVKTWMIDELMPFARKTYVAMGEALGISCIREISIVDCFPTPQMRLAFLHRLEADPQYLSLEAAPAGWSPFLKYDFGLGIISPCYLVDVPGLLQAFRSALVSRNMLVEETVDYNELVMDDEGVRYKHILARKAVCCDGVYGARNPYFGNLPFAPGKGEALIAEIRDLPATAILKKGISIVPWKDGLFWIGASNEWQFETDQPTPAFREKTIAQLQSFVKMPFTITDHLAAVRPATLERRPFAGFHPRYPRLGIFNGMGTKGCSLAPYFAAQLAAHCAHGTPLLAEADVQRFRKVLERRMGRDGEWSMVNGE